MRKIAIFLTTIMVIALAACGGHDAAPDTTSIRDENLAKLAKVWGFAKYTHPAFLTGEMCWDEELLNLIPIVYSAYADDVNAILYEWLVSLGDDGWGDYRLVIVEAWANFWMPLLDELQWLSIINRSHSENLVTFRAQIYEGDLPRFEILESWLLGWEIIDENGIANENDNSIFRQMADFNWINEYYLGMPLYEHLSRFQAIRPLGRTNAPVSFDHLGNSVFTNQRNHEDMDFGDIRYRLLGLFRMWNAMEYYFPYRDILDRDWHELLTEHIAMMFEDDDRLSYEMALASLSMNLHDAHVVFLNTTDFLYSKLPRISSFMHSTNAVFLDADFFNGIAGYFLLPARLAEAEGRLVVSEPMPDTGLMPGDVILAINSRDIDHITADMLRFLSYPNDEKALAYLSRLGLWSQTSDMTVTILRDDARLQLEVEFYGWETNDAMPSHERLESNIGLINPAHLSHNEIHDIMRDFADTDGLIIDFRQYPSDFIAYSLAEYLVEQNQLFAIVSSPSISVPGVFKDSFRGYSGGVRSPEAYFYENPVVLLMYEWTISRPEFTIMSLRNGSNVTVMGNNSIGADGNVTILPLPGGISMVYTGLGVYTPEGGQTQRIGLSPDIYVHRTIQGIAEGRDELMEAAIRYILGD